MLRSSFNYFQISQNRNQTQANSLKVMLTFTNDVPKSTNGNTDLQVHCVVFLELVYFKTTPKMIKRKQVVCYCDGVVLEIYLDYKFQWPEEGLNSWPNGLGNYFVCKRFEVQTLLWSLEFVIQINLEHDTITWLEVEVSEVVFWFDFAVYTNKFTLLFFSLTLSVYIYQVIWHSFLGRTLAERNVLAFNKEDDKWVFFSVKFSENCFSIFSYLCLFSSRRIWVFFANLDRTP